VFEVKQETRTQYRKWGWRLCLINPALLNPYIHLLQAEHRTRSQALPLALAQRAAVKRHNRPWGSRSWSCGHVAHAEQETCLTHSTHRAGDVPDPWHADQESLAGLCSHDPCQWGTGVRGFLWTRGVCSSCCNADREPTWSQATSSKPDQTSL